MDAAALRMIGKDLLERFSRMRLKGAQALERGAGGDRSFAFDKVAEEAILRGLAALGEPFRVLSEEAGILQVGGAGGGLVVVDPVDGSRNAAAGVPFFGTSIAVADGDEVGSIRLAYVLNLVNGDEFVAERGKGAFLNGEPISTQKDDVLKLVSFEAQSPKADMRRMLPLIEAARKTRCFGAVALDLAYLAGGSISVFANPAPSRSFDYAAGYLIAKEAGGVVTDFDGGPIEHEGLSLRRGASLLASGNRALHEKSLRLLHA